MITSEDIKRLAALARIGISAEEAESLRADLDRILAYVSELSSVPTDGIEPPAYRSGGFTGVPPNLFAGWQTSRDDRSRETALPGDAARAVFPAARDGYCEVPEVFSE